MFMVFIITFYNGNRRFAIKRRGYKLWKETLFEYSTTKLHCKNCFSWTKTIIVNYDKNLVCNVDRFDGYSQRDNRIRINQNCLAMSYSQARLVLLIFLRKIFWFTDRLINYCRIAYMYLWGYTNGELNLQVIKSSCIREGVNEQEAAVGILIDIRITFDKRQTRMRLTSSGILIDIRITFHKREMRMCMTSSGILIDIRITFDKRQTRMRMTCSGILINIRITFDKRETRMCMISSGILIDIRIRFDKREMKMCMTSSGILIDIRNYLRKENVHN